MPAYFWVLAGVMSAVLIFGICLAWFAGIYLLAHGADDATTFDGDE